MILLLGRFLKIGTPGSPVDSAGEEDIRLGPDMLIQVTAIIRPSRFLKIMLRQFTQTSVAVNKEG
jgi:hypothetical protein